MVEKKKFREEYIEGLKVAGIDLFKENELQEQPERKWKREKRRLWWNVMKWASEERTEWVEDSECEGEKMRL